MFFRFIEYNYDKFLTKCCKKFQCSVKDLSFDNLKVESLERARREAPIFYNAICKIEQENFIIETEKAWAHWFCGKIKILEEHKNYIVFVSDYREFIVYVGGGAILVEVF